MKFQPKTQKQIDEEKLLPEGDYPFQVSNAKDSISKKGNEMIEVIVRVFKPDGSFVLVTDYLMEAIAYKLRHAAEACGLLHEYESGVLAADAFVGKVGTVKLKIQKDKDGKWPDKNVIGDYIVPKAGEAPPKLPVKDDFEGDAIPF